MRWFHKRQCYAELRRWYTGTKANESVLKDWPHEPIYDWKLSSPTFKPEDESCPGILMQAARTGTETDVSLPERGYFLRVGHSQVESSSVLTTITLR